MRSNIRKLGGEHVFSNICMNAKLRPYAPLQASYGVFMGKTPYGM
jgi:hypothetical protein